MPIDEGGNCCVRGLWLDREVLEVSLGSAVSWGGLRVYEVESGITWNESGW